MASQHFAPRKRRTRQHIIADLSVHHLERFILEEGHTAQRLGPDYGYDLILFTYDANGYAEPGSVYFQLKAAETWQAVDSDFVFDLDIRDYNLWMEERDPVVLVLFEATSKRAYWIAVQNYFRKDVARQPKKGAKTVRVHVPTRQRVNRAAVAKFREFKRKTQQPVLGVLS
jgi:hypothetical protein